MQLANLITYLLPLLAAASPIVDAELAPQSPGLCVFRGTSDVNTQVTKDCCAAVRHSAYYSSPVMRCMPNGGPAGRINEGDFGNCCRSRGTDVQIRA
jgi:hypothetical protein